MDGVWLAALSGVIGGGTLLVGAAVAWFVDIPQRVVAGIMALGAGVLISTLAFELVEEAADIGGLVPTSVGFLGGAILYIVADWLVTRPRAPKTAGAASGAGVMPGAGAVPGAAPGAGAVPGAGAGTALGAGAGTALGAGAAKTAQSE